MNLMSLQLTAFSQIYVKPTENNIEDADRNEEMYGLYLRGETLQSIGEKFHLTRQRVQQLMIRTVTKKIRQGIWDGTINNPEHKRIKDLVNEEIGRIKNQKVYVRTTSKLQAAIGKGIVPEKYTSVLKFARDVGLNPVTISKTAPEIPQKIRENIPVGQGGKKWSRFYLKCRLCGTSTIRHQCYGYCRKCFPKTEIFKDFQAASRLRNQDRWKKHTENKLEEYYQKHFGGNRNAVLKRDNYTCVGCGITDTQSQKVYKGHLRVVHLDKLSDNRMDNLITACKSCSFRYVQSKRRKK